MEQEIFLQEKKEELNSLLRPFQKELNGKQRMADFLKLCIRLTEKDDFLQLDEILKSKIADDTGSESQFKDIGNIFDQLKGYTSQKVDEYRVQFLEDLNRMAIDAALPFEIDFPRFFVMKGIEGEVDFSARTTTINNKTLKSIDPRRIVAAGMRLKKQLYDRSFDPQSFIDNLYKAYFSIIQKEKLSPGDTAPIQKFYLEYVISLQSKAFFANMDKAKFKGYSLEQFAVDIWCFFESEISKTSDGMVMQLRPGRNSAMWLIDSDGERRKITGISFQEQAE